MRRFFTHTTLVATAIFASACQSDPFNLAPVFNVVVVDAALSDMVKNDRAVGAAALIYRNNTPVYYGQAGHADREAGRIWSRDTKLAIHSMTKPIAGVTLMTFWEDGAFKLNEPLSTYLPEFADMRVFDGLDDDGTVKTVPASRPIQIIDIMRHTAGFGYGWEGTDMATIMTRADVGNPAKPLSQMSSDLAALPLYYQPGTQWRYSVAVDIQARLVEVLSGQPFETVMRERVLEPLGMIQTSYFVPLDARENLAAVYERKGVAPLTRRADARNYSFATTEPVQKGGGSGLISTIDDYMRFALMLQNGGTLDGVRILQPDTIALMARDHLPGSVSERDFLPSKGQMGFGLDFAVRIAPPKTVDEPYGFVGEFFWDGAASPLFWVDPENNITAVFLTQVRPFDGTLHADIRKAVYKAAGLYDDGKALK